MSTEERMAQFIAEAEAKYPLQPTVTGWDIATGIKRQAHVNAKMEDAELIQQLVDALASVQGRARSFTSPMDPEAIARYERINSAFIAAASAGFTPPT